MTAPLDVGSIEARAVTLYASRGAVIRWWEESLPPAGAVREEWRALTLADFGSLLAAARECGEVKAALLDLIDESAWFDDAANVHGAGEHEESCFPCDRIVALRAARAKARASLKAGAGGGA